MNNALSAVGCNVVNVVRPEDRHVFERTRATAFYTKLHSWFKQFPVIVFRPLVDNKQE